MTETMKTCIPRKDAPTGLSLLNSKILKRKTARSVSTISAAIPMEKAAAEPFSATIIYLQTYPEAERQKVLSPLRCLTTHRL